MLKFFYCCAIISIAFHAYLHAQSDCKLKKDQDGIRVYTCHTDTSQFKSIVAEFTLKATLDQLSRFVMNAPNYTHWQYNTIDAKVLRKISDSEQIYHTVIEAPWPVTDRDMVVHLRIKMNHDRKGLTILTESEDKVIPRDKRFVRVPSSHAQWIVKQENEKLHIKYAMQIDPGGSVPVWLVNWVCAQAPYQSFKNLKKILERGKASID